MTYRFLSRRPSISLTSLAACGLLCAAGWLAVGCTGETADPDAPTAETAATPEASPSAVRYEAAYPEDVSADELSEQDTAQHESAHAGDHPHGEDGDHSHEGDADHDHDDGAP